jgi:hypothetical protein
MKEIIEKIINLAKIYALPDNPWEEVIELATSALDKLKAQEEAERFMIKVFIPGLDHGYCGRCPMKYFDIYKDYKCILGYMNKLQKPTIQCLRYQKEKP